MAPATLRRMAEDLALLPIWYAQPGSGVLASSAYNADYLKQMQQLFRLCHQMFLLLYNRQDSKLPNFYLPYLRFQVFHLLPMLYLQDHCNLLLHL